MGKGRCFSRNLPGEFSIVGKSSVAEPPWRLLLAGCEVATGLAAFFSGALNNFAGSHIIIETLENDEKPCELKGKNTVIGC